MISLLKPLRIAAVRFGAGMLYYSGSLKVLRGSCNQPRLKENRVFPFAILLYHRVNPDNDPFFPAVSVRAFEAHMRYLAKHFRVCSVKHILDRIQEGRGIDPWTIAITFDDGYRDNYTYAHPIMKKYHLPATIFAATGYIGGKRAMWNDRLAWAFKCTEQKKLVFESRNGQKRFPLVSGRERINALVSVLDELKNHSEEEKEGIVSSIIGELKTTGKVCPEPLMLDWSELRSMAGERWEVGSHTVNHVILTRVQTARVAEELRASKRVLENEIQLPVSLFAYPNGKKSDFSPSTKEFLRKACYQGAVTTVDGFNGGATDFFELFRRNPWDAHLPSFATKTTLKYWKEIHANQMSHTTGSFQHSTRL